jgi:hypothetical protein
MEIIKLLYIILIHLFQSNQYKIVMVDYGNFVVTYFVVHLVLLILMKLYKLNDLTSFFNIEYFRITYFTPNFILNKHGK